MVRLIHKTKIASIATLAVAAPAVLASISMPAHADNPQNVDFNVNVAEVLTVSITDPASWASGELSNKVGDKYVSNLLRNKVNVSASTNNAVGVTVSMYTENTNLVNQTNNSYTIPTLASQTVASSFPVNYWGYSKDDTVSGSDSANYYPLTSSASPIRLFSTVGTASTGSGSQDVYFGAKADNTEQSGTYAQTVYFVAVTDTVDSETNPEVPINPAEPSTVDEIAEYKPTTGSTSYTRRYSSNTGSTTPNPNPVSGDTKTNRTEVSKGDTTNSYAAAQGVTTKSGIDGGSSVAVALGVASAVAATSGILFFVAAKRRKDDEDE